MSKPTANWERVGDKFYRKVQLYTAVFDQDLELENYNVVGAPYSGAVGRLSLAISMHGRHLLKQPYIAMKRRFKHTEALRRQSRASISTVALEN